MGGISDIFLFSEGIFKNEPDQRIKFRKSNKGGKFVVKKVKNKGAVSKNVVRVTSLQAPLKVKGGSFWKSGPLYLPMSGKCEFFSIG